MQLTSRAGLAVLMTCMAAAAAVTPAAAADSVPLTDPLSQERMAGLDVESVDSPVRAISPRLGLDAPLTEPGAGPLGLPAPRVPGSALLTPALQADPSAGTRLS